jgi:UDP-3-O-[3-hydroxymyristoyl] glucosamine N-acyltransferase
MADPRFFNPPPSRLLSDIVRHLGLPGSAVPDGQPDPVIADVAPLETAAAGHISFLDNIKYKEAFAVTKASACIVSPKMASFAPPGVALIVSETPYKVYARTAQIFYPDSFPAPDLSGRAVIDPTADIGAGCRIDPGVVVGARAVIGAGSWIEANAVIGAGVVLGRQCRVGANATISHALIGDHVRLYPGARVGQDGFGFAIDPAGHVKVPQLGRVVIEDHVEIGANTCIDRGAGPDTVIGAGTWIDNLVQIAHNVKIGRGCVLVGQCGIAGSTVLEDYVVLAAQSGVAGHIRLGKGAQVAAKSGVLRDIPAGAAHMGYPSVPIKEFWRQIAILKRLTNRQKSE